MRNMHDSMSRRNDAIWARRRQGRRVRPSTSGRRTNATAHRVWRILSITLWRSWCTCSTRVCSVPGWSTYNAPHAIRASCEHQGECFTPRFTHFNSFLSLFIVLLLLLSHSFDCVYFLSQFLCGRQIQPVFTSKGCLKDLEVETTAMDGVRTNLAVGYGDVVRMNSVSLQGSLALERAVEHHIGIG